MPLEQPEAANGLYVERLTAELDSSKSVARAVLLGMDGVYGTDGQLDEHHTDFLISNDYLLSVCEAGLGKLLAGVSVNPRRRGAVEELQRLAERGAALVKVLPNAQVFDPSDKAFLPYYKALAKLGLPLLCHVGYEFSLIGQDQSVGDPARLKPALDEGVTVIGAHGCSFGLFLYEKYLPAMLELLRRYRNFYLDASALTLPNRALALLKLRAMPEVFDRLLFGTDYPLPCFSFPALAAGPAAFLRARRPANRFDLQASVLDELGVRCGADFLDLAPESAREKRRPA